MILPNCRLKLKKKDFDFVISELAKSDDAEQFLKDSIADGENIDSFLESPTLHSALLNKKERLDISPELLFYVGIGKEMRSMGYKDREVIDYVASMLSRFIASDRWRRISRYDERKFERIVDLKISLAETPVEMRFLHYAHIGNLSLFLSGFFPEYVSKDNRSRRLPMGLEYYEDQGSEGYSSAAENEQSWKSGLKDTFEFLAYNFHETRTAINNFKAKLPSCRGN